MMAQPILSEKALSKIDELKESWENVRLFEKEYFKNPTKTTLHDLQQSYAVLTGDVGDFLKHCDRD